jgi:hypothetical protein
MVASAFLPVALFKGKLYFLFGKEAPGDSTPGFSDFGGGVEDHEDIYKAGLRELAEETTGFFGGPDALDHFIRKQGGVLPMVHDTYHIHIFRMDYDPKMTEYYNNNHAFVYERMNHRVLKKTMIFEKIEMKWMTIPEMKRRRHEFRSFYQVILDKIIRNAPAIRRFIRGTQTTRHRRASYRRKTMKQR